MFYSKNFAGYSNRVGIRFGGLKNCFVALWAGKFFQAMVWLRFATVGYHPPVDEKHGFFYDPKPQLVIVPIHPWHELDDDYGSQPQLDDEFVADRDEQYERECEDADQRELEFLASEHAPDDRWRFDHLGEDPLG